MPRRSVRTQADARSRGFRVLIAEDTEPLRALLHQIVTDLGHNPILARDGWEGWRLFCRVHPDVVITDLDMPNWDGWRFIKTIRTCQAATRRCPIIACSSHLSGTVINQTIDRGANAYVTKPVSVGELACALRNLDVAVTPPTA